MEQLNLRKQKLRRFNVEKVKCAYCNRVYFRATKTIRGGLERRGKNIRPKNTKTCSPICSRNYSTFRKNYVSRMYYQKV